MTNRPTSICMVLLLMLASCTTPYQKKNKDIQAQIEQIWRLSDENLDSAIVESKRLEGVVYTSSEYTRMKYDLLNIRLRYKKYIPASSIDSIKKVTSFMEKQGIGKDKMRAYYYMSGIYEDLLDSPRAIEYALKSLDCQRHAKSCDTIIAQRCYSLLSEIYREQHNTQEAINTALAGLKIAEQIDHSKCWYTMDVATSYNMAGDEEMAMKYYDKAYRLLLQENKHRTNLQLIAEMARVYAQREKYKKADTLACIMEKIPEHKQLYAYYYAKGVICYASNAKDDSTIMYFKKAVDLAPNTREKLTPLNYLFNISNGKQDYKSSAIYAWLYQKSVQELHQHEQQEWIKNARGIFEYQKDKEKEDTMAWENITAKLWGVSVTCALLCALSTIAALHFRHKKKMFEANIGKARELTALQDALQAKTKEIQEKEKELGELVQNYREIEEELARRKAQTEEITRLTNLTQSKTELGQTIEEAEKAARTGKGLSEEKWQELLRAVDSRYPTFKTSVAERIPRINEALLRTCYLLKIGMSNQQIEALTQSARQTVWNRVKKIKEAMNEEFATGKHEC